jgi:mono/diheme cytochrome c family protein
MNLRLSTSLVALLLLVSCNETLVKGGNANEKPLQLSSISYADVDTKIFRPRCYGCHGTSGGVNVQSYESVKSNISRIQAAVDSGRMPAGGPLPSSLKQLLSIWIAKGMPLDPVEIPQGEIGGGGGGGDLPTLPPLAPTYASLKENLFNASCTVCHNANSPRLPQLTSREAIIDPREELIDLRRPERSLLLKVIRNRTFPRPVPEHGDDDQLQMPPVSSGIEAVSAEKIQVLEEWIRRGAPE